MGQLDSASAPVLPPVSRSQLSIQKPPTALDSSDEARTDTSSSPFMYSAQSPASDVKGRPKTAPTTTVTIPSTSSTSGRRRKADTSSEHKPAPKQRKYERKTKRFIWPDDLHRLFVAAIFDVLRDCDFNALVGLKNASPKALLALMEAAGPNSGLTTEHLKSHLQKYRLNYERSRTEFLAYYDRSAKRNLKRHRRQAQNRANKAGSDANTMFVFPISNSKCRNGRRRDGSDSNDGDSDTGDSNATDNNLQLDAKKQDSSPRARSSSVSGTGSPTSTQGYTQLVQNTRQQAARNHLPSLPNGRTMTGTSATMPTDLVPIVSHHSPRAYAQSQRKQPLDNNRDLAVAAVANRYPLGQLLGPVTGGVSGMPELTDPQWSILNSLMSPQLAGMIGPEPEVATSEALTRGADGFMLNEEPTDLQVQMHLAMQAQMNLHRQMLTRKVEVAQHLAGHSSIGRTASSSLSDSRGNLQMPSRNFNESLGSAQQLRQQSFPEQQSQTERHEDPLALLPRPSLSLSASDAVSTSNVPIAATSMISEGVSVLTSTGSAVGANGAAGSTAEAKGMDDGMDLYRWDRIDLNVELDDDDLFGFLKS
ncbi:hypothetical protein PsorP6_012941 [Peronosclerospora sorghi]|uniref:Uncharacterized protein n=1 Tax=Peronosclerospora sorghi TaxID=230839 RepID=A0ACC0WHN6_9STRA|nr:hypothetical protein PsorP6_012941 [Peronosclerospora sorghi]